MVSTNEFELRAVHLPGDENRVADWLSRWDLSEKYQKMFSDFASGTSYEEIYISYDMFKFSNSL